MFKIKKLTKYTLFALTFAFVLFLSIPNNANASYYDDYYVGIGADYGGYEYSFDSTPSYSYPDNNYYVQDSYSYPDTNYYVEEPSYYYPSYDNSYYDNSYYDNSYYGGSYGDYSYGVGGCSSCYYGGNYSYPQITYVPYTPPVTPPPVVKPALEASCYISPNSVYINDTVTMSANATGGTGSYTYYWSGSDGISGSSQVITGRFTSIGLKTVSLTVTSGTQSVTRTCSATVNQRYDHNYNYPNYNYNYNYTNLTATCVASPVNANVGDNVIWTVYPTGGNGAYTYSWIGTDNLSYGNAYQIQQRYFTPGVKTATVTVRASNGQSVVATCNTNIIGSVINNNPISGIYLNDVPATGISFNLKVALYILGLVLWSAFVGFMLVERRKAKFALANRGRIEDFKQENLRKKGLL